MVNQEEVRNAKQGKIGAEFYAQYSGVAAAVDEALVKLEANGHISLPADYNRCMVKWDTQAEVEAAIPVHFEWQLAKGDWPTHAAAMRKFLVGWQGAGGEKPSLSTVIDHALLRLCGAGRLRPPPASAKLVAVSAFSGSGVGHQAFLDAGYDHVLDADIVTSLHMGPHVDAVQYAAAYNCSTTLTRAGKAGAFVEHLCQQPAAVGAGVREPDTHALAIAFPCRTYVLNDCFRPLGTHFREASGEPRHFEPGAAVNCCSF